MLVIAQTNTGDATARPAVLYFSPPGESASSGNVTLNSSGNIAVDVKVNTHSANSAGADVIVTFNTSELELVSGTMPGSGSGTFYPTVVKGVTSPSTANSTGRISMARVIQAPDEGSTPVYTNGDGVFANLVFKPKASSPVGTTVNLSFDFTLGSTTDSNVAGTTTTNPDILGAAKSAALTIQQGSTDTELSSVTVTPSSANLAPSASQTFTATANTTTGVTYTWSLSGSGSLSATTGSSVTYTAGSSTGSATIAVTATQGSITKTDSSPITISGNVVVNGPVIDHIVPGEGDEDVDIEVEIYGSYFGSDDGRVYIGTRLADIISWSDTKIVVLVPQVNVSRDTEYQVKVRRSDGEEARYTGYTYLDKTGLPMLPWLIMFPLNGAAAVLAKKRWFKRK